MPRRTGELAHPGLANKKSEQVLSKPFADWLNRRVAFHEARIRARLPMAVCSDASGLLSPTAQTAEEIGWPGEAGLRRLYRYRRQIMAGSVNKVKGDRHSDWVPRRVVEEALHHAGVGLWEVYPELVEDIILEPDAFCDTCDEITTPLEGVCPWCENVPDRKLAA